MRAKLTGEEATAADRAAVDLPPPPSWPSAAARQGAFGTTMPEVQDGCVASVSGRLPEWLSGAYIRNGPGTYANGTAEGMAHMFDGYAMLIKLEIDGASNAVTGSHRFLESQSYAHFKRTGGMKWREFATPAPRSSALGKAADVATMALGSMGLTQGVTATLRTLGPVHYGDSLWGDLTTAHPTLLPNGDLVNLLSAPGVGFTVYRQAAATGQEGPPIRTAVATVSHRRPLAPAWVHDFPASREHVVIPETPLYFNLGALMLGKSTDHIFLDWAPQDGTTLHVVRLCDGAVRSFRAPPFFVFHWANAFESEDGRYLHLDAALYDDPAIVNHLYLSLVWAGPTAAPAAQLPPATLKRLTLDLHAPDGSDVPSAWQPLITDDASYGNFVEFPSVAPARRGRPYRFAWTTAAVRPTNVNNALAKMDVDSGVSTLWHDPGGMVGEPTFVPRPGGDDEDDGVVLSVVAQPDGAAALVVLNGRSFQEVARAVLPYSLTNGFHGGFIPSSSEK